MRWIASESWVMRSARAARRLFAGPPSASSAWSCGLADEQAFWDRWLRAADSPGFRFRMDPMSPLQPWIESWMDPSRSVQRIIDVGSGPLSVLGRRSAIGPIEISCCDPLAREYKLLLERHNIAPPHTVVAVPGEALSSHFPRGHFDVSFSNNAIDHALDPLRVLREMALVTRPGGAVIVQVADREGRRASYTGLHQWDCSMDEGRFKVAARNSEAIDVASALADLVEPAAIERVPVSPAGIPWDPTHIRAVFLRKNRVQTIASVAD